MKKTKARTKQSAHQIIQAQRAEIVFLEDALQEALSANAEANRGVQILAGAEIARHQFHRARSSTASAYAKAALTGLLSGYAARKDTFNLTADEIARQAWAIAKAMKDHED